MTRSRSVVLSICLFLAVDTVAATPPARSIPRPLPSHPGNIFLAGEPVLIPIPGTKPVEWKLEDFESKTSHEGTCSGDRVDLGRLAAGYYELVLKDQQTNRIALGVIEALRAPVPLTSPIGIDVAMAWLYPPDKMSAVANLCALAGMNRVRDRLNWAEIEPDRGKFSSSNRYDLSVQTQAAAGLQVLEVNHFSPAWASPIGKRFPLDLRDAYNFHREIAGRWQGKVQAYEPWNEADIDMFGGHTGSEMASMQKAAYLGLKAGNPKATACWNVFAIHRAATLRDMQENEAWPYFDTYNLHHYEPFEKYPKLYADHRAVSAGRPLWVSECSLPSKWTGDEKAKELSATDMRVQAERLVKTYALSLHEGTRAMFYFMLPHYVEGPTQFGILRADLTPRPAFISLGAVGRLLADATPRGALSSITDSNAAQGYVFEARPDGRKSTILVTWSDHGARLDLPSTPRARFDLLGRPVSVTGPQVALTPAPQFVVLKNTRGLRLVPPPVAPKLLSGKPFPIVLQAFFAPTNTVLKESAYRIAKDATTTVQLLVYNFGEKPARGAFAGATPGGWNLELPNHVEVLPGERKELQMRVTPPPQWRETATIAVRGKFSGGEAILSFRIRP